MYVSLDFKNANNYVQLKTGLFYRTFQATELGDFPISFLNLKSLKVLPIFDSGQNYMVKIPVSDGFILIKVRINLA